MGSEKTIQISIRLNETDAQLIKAFAEKENLTISELMRRATMDKIQEDYDLIFYGLKTHKMQTIE